MNKAGKLKQSEINLSLLECNVVMQERFKGYTIEAPVLVAWRLGIKGAFGIFIHQNLSKKLESFCLTRKGNLSTALAKDWLTQKKNIYTNSKIPAVPSFTKQCYMNGSNTT